MTPEQRRQQARNAANVRWSRRMARQDQAVVARAAMLRRLEHEVDPDGKLPPDERAVRVREARRRLSARLNAAKEDRRRRRRDGTGEEDQ